MAVTIDTNKSAADYAKALTHLLPPGAYFATNSAKKLTQAQAEELARIHAKTDNEFKISVSKDTNGWTLQHYRSLLSDAGMSNFLVFDKTRLQFHTKAAKAGKLLGDKRNIYKIFIVYKAKDKAIFQSILAKLQQHKLTHTLIITFQFYKFYTGQRCTKSILTVI